MFKKIFPVYLLISAYLLLSCEFNNSSCSRSSGNHNALSGIAQLGNLAGATVEIYKVENNGSLVLQWVEYTSSGDSLEEIGRFNPHLDDIEAEVFYLYKVYGGEDWDADDDGIKDELPTENKGRIRLIAKGSDLKNMDQVRITIASEIVYEKIAKYLKYNFNPLSFGAILEKEIKSTIDDINGDGQVDFKDLVSFDPVKNKNNLIEAYRYKINEMTDSIHRGEFIFDKFNYIIGSVDTLGKARNTAVLESENIAYVADSSAGVQVIDISDISSPVIINSMDTDNAYDVFVVPDEHLLLVADGISGLKIYDISSPKNPSLISNFETDDTAIDIEAAGSLIFIVEPSNIQIVDISTPTDPVLKGSFTTDDSYKIKISSDESKAFIADGISGIKIVDISNPSNPQLISSLDTDGKTFSLALSPDETKVYIADGVAGFKIIDISNIDEPVEISRFDTAWSARDIALSLDGKNVYITDGYAGVYAIDVSDYRYPLLLGVCKTKDYAYGITTISERKIALISDMSAGIQIIDMKDIKNPYILTSLKTAFSTRDMAVSPDRSIIYMASTTAGLQVLDLSRPESPEIVSSLETSMARGIAVSSDGKKVYISDYSEGLKIIDVSNYLNPELIKVIDTPGLSYDVALSGDETLAFIADDTQGIQIVDIQNAAIINSISGIGRSRSVALSQSGNIIFTATGSNLTAVNISDIDNPQVMSYVDTPGYTNGVILLDNETLAYIPDATSGITIVDVSNPNNLSVIKSIKTGLYASSVSLSEDEKTAYVSASYSGLYILDVTDPLNPLVKKIIKTPGSTLKAVEIRDSIILVSDREFGLLIIDASMLE
ncbi:LVIVD repeat-containing protein [Persephonella sp.]